MGCLVVEAMRRLYPVSTTDTYAKTVSRVVRVYKNVDTSAHTNALLYMNFAFDRKAGSELSGESRVLGIKSVTPRGEPSSEVWTATRLQEIGYNENFGKFGNPS